MVEHSTIFYPFFLANSPPALQEGELEMIREEYNPFPVRAISRATLDVSPCVKTYCLNLKRIRYIVAANHACCNRMVGGFIN